MSSGLSSSKIVHCRSHSWVGFLLSSLTFKVSAPPNLKVVSLLCSLYKRWYLIATTLLFWYTARMVDFLCTVNNLVWNICLESSRKLDKTVWSFCMNEFGILCYLQKLIDWFSSSLLQMVLIQDCRFLCIGKLYISYTVLKFSYTHILSYHCLWSKMVNW